MRTTSATKYLWFLTLSYCMALAFANWFDPRLVKLGPLVTDAGTLIFPLTYLLSDIITEVYGYKHARRAIWVGFLFNILFLAYGQLILNLPSPSYQTNNNMFATIMAADARIVFASLFSYLIAEPLNSYIMAKLKILTQGRNMALRFVASTLVAAGVDSFIFGVAAFYAVMNNINLLILILTMWLIKILTEIILLPLSVYLTKRIKKAEQLDIYDNRTKFNLFSLNADYQKNDNHFQ
ncbi:MAG: queuosine precursor transporter [Gammaproteobacteria bacterium]|nr:queuosine precursor transporter [Gammaproteobacteria bacterium]